MSQEHFQERKESETLCNVRLAPLVITHTAILVIAMVWLAVILTA